MNFLKKKFKGVGGKKPGGTGQRLDSEGTASANHTPSDAKDAAKLAAERRFALEQEKQAQADARRRERQMKLEEDRLLQQQFREMSIQEQEEYHQKLKEQEATTNEEAAPVKKKFNPVLYTSPMVGEGLVAGPANELFQQLADVIQNSVKLIDEQKREYAARLFHTANSTDAKEKALTRMRKIVQMICENPDEVKYREVKRQHPLYADTVMAAIGAEMYLLLIGFEIAEVPEKGSVIRLVDGTDLDLLPVYLDYFESTITPLELDVYRHAKVYFLAENVNIEPIKVPDWTYKLSSAEIAALQKEREKEVEWWMTVCSKRPRSVPTPFKVSVIRIRFPNSAVLEALFGVHESISDVFNVVSNLLGYSSESFVLSESIGNKFDSNSTETIGELKLVPSAVLHFKFVNQNYPLPTQHHVKQCQEARHKMDFTGVDITDYKF